MLISGHRDELKALAVLRPLSRGKPVCRVEVGPPASLSGLPLRPSPQAGVSVIQPSLVVPPFPSTRVGCCLFALVLRGPWVLCLPLGPSTLTSRECDRAETPEDSGKKERKVSGNCGTHAVSPPTSLPAPPPPLACLAPAATCSLVFPFHSVL